MKSVMRIIVFVPLALVILFFSMANRGPVKIGLDPFAASDAAAPYIEAPLFLVVLASMAVGVLAGGVSSWLGHLPVRRAAKIARTEAKKTRLEIEKLRQQALAELPAEAKAGKR
ncbi:lipopolysaccharide assembly protein LapA domain-containing protein [Methylocystis parvus]|uniref:LapA family protein n=1 Tax=Methylocystis parvus TaxID=134 RepID=A0A6B8M1L4_9HYPH|nr:LapA family protein [Methylocystis parvus]QGM97694.1 LapA family protein [Methylocystis parvus]WBJ98371.1 LapA family protein [Methylocystis parvus OBBP]